MRCFYTQCLSSRSLYLYMCSRRVFLSICRIPRLLIDIFLPFLFIYMSSMISSRNHPGYNANAPKWSLKLKPTVTRIAKCSRSWYQLRRLRGIFFGQGRNLWYEHGEEWQYTYQLLLLLLPLRSFLAFALPRLYKKLPTAVVHLCLPRCLLPPQLFLPQHDD
jgi:hypothetical protein